MLAGRRAEGEVTEGGGQRSDLDGGFGAAAAGGGGGGALQQGSTAQPSRAGSDEDISEAIGACRG